VKTINFLTTHFLPENTAATNRVVTYVKELEKFYKVNIFALGEKGQKRVDSMKYSGNSTVYYLNQEDFDQKNFVKRALHEMKHIFKLINLAKTKKCDLTIATAPYMFMIPFVAFLIKDKKILDIRDLVWEYLAQESFFQKSVKSFLRGLMISSIKKYNFVIVTNENEKKWLTSHVKVKNVAIIPNGIEREKYEILSSLPLKEPKKFTVTYVGNIGIAQNLRVLIECARELEDMEFNIIGDGAEYDELKEYCEKFDIKNVNMIGKKSWREILDYYENSSVLYAQLDSNFSSAMPSKLYEYASTGLPIIYGGVGVAAEFVKRLENAYSIKPNDKEALKEALLKVRDRGFSISEKNREFIKDNFIREDQVRKIKDIVEETLSSK